MIIYKTTNLVNNKIYIGQSKKNNPNYYGSGILIKKAIKKYGKDNFKKEILCFCESPNDLNEQEKFWIKKFNSTDLKFGYNIEKGGADGIHTNKREKSKYIFTQKHKDNISKGSRNKPKTKKHIESISKFHADVSGDKNPMFNKKHTDKTKIIISIKNKGRKKSEYEVKKISLRTKGEKNIKAKLTEKDVLTIRSLYPKLTLTEISKKYDVQFACIEKIIKRRTWKHVS